MKHKILIASINLCILSYLLSDMVYGQEEVQQQLESTKLEKEITKLEKEIESLEQQIAVNEDFARKILEQGVGQGITLIGIAGGAAAAAFFAWQRERRIPPPAEQEEIIENIVKQWYSRSHLLVYDKIWNEIQQQPFSEQLVDYYYERLSRKRFDWSEFPKIKKEVENPPKQYLIKKLHLKEGTDEIDNRIESIKNIADFEYYEQVRVILPSVIDNAVASALGNSTNLEQIDYEELVKKSLKTVKRLMIFYTLREDETIVEILIRAKVHEKIQESKKSNC
jgi:hypothetical protein